jgi:hypothetical protein
VPLYNAVPWPSGATYNLPVGPGAAVELRPVVEALEAGVPVLRSVGLAIDAPPAFLMDAHRRHGSGRVIAPGMFDNRSVSLPTDFPSANLLLSRGIKRVALVQASDVAPQADLAHTLLRWQEAGLRMNALSLSDDVKRLLPIIVQRPGLFRMMWQRMTVLAGLRRNPLGGFGGMLPVPSEGGIGGGGIG